MVDIQVSNEELNLITAAVCREKRRATLVPEEGVER